MDQFTAQYHLPGLFEFYALYRLFLPLFFEHREYFYDWCGIGSIYGAPEGCLWGGGRVGCGDCDPRDALALLRDYGISALPDVQQFPCCGRSTCPTRAAMRCAACSNRAEKTGSLSIPTCWWITCGSIIRGCISSRPRQRS